MAASRVAHRPGGSVAQGKRLTSLQLPNAARPRGAALVAETPRLGSPSAGVPHPERATHSPPSALPCGGARAHGAAPPPPGRARFTDRDLPHVSTRPSLLPMTRAAARAPQRPTSTRALQPAAAGGRRARPDAVRAGGGARAGADALAAAEQQRVGGALVAGGVTPRRPRCCSTVLASHFMCPTREGPRAPPGRF